jgi:UDP-N-acetyl-D-galactosamine dehydrogenase
MSTIISVIGLGYVGFDLNQPRINELNSGHDSTLEVEDEILKAVLAENTSMSKGHFCSANLDDIKDSNYSIVTVRTPVDKHNKPDLTPLYSASKTVGYA